MINVCRGVVKIVQCVRVAYQGLCEILIIRVSWLQVCCLRFDVLWRYFTLYFSGHFLLLSCSAGGLFGRKSEKKMDF